MDQPVSRMPARGACCGLLLAVSCWWAPAAAAQEPGIRYGEKVPAEVKLIYERGLKYLASSQQSDGSWSGGQQGGGITGMCLMAFLAHGEDPNFGSYSLTVQRAVRNIILSQDASTGFIPSSMYHHGFAMLALAEAYGSVDDALIWDEGDRNKRSIGAALELSVRAALTAQKKNRYGGWRYSPGDTRADTSVSGAVLMGLLAARNAGIEVPDEAIDRALGFYRSSTSAGGIVGYTGGSSGGPGDTMCRASVATLVYAVGKRKEWTEYKSTLGHISNRLDHVDGTYPFYFRYYMAQALFQGDFENWTKWKRENARMLAEMQNDDGSIASGHGPAYGTAMSLLSLALDYRFLPIYER